MGKGKYRFPPYVCYSPSCTGHNKIASNIIALVSVQILDHLLCPFSDNSQDIYWIELSGF